MSLFSATTHSSSDFSELKERAFRFSNTGRSYCTWSLTVIKLAGFEDTEPVCSASCRQLITVGIGKILWVTLLVCCCFFQMRWRNKFLRTGRFRWIALVQVIPMNFSSVWLYCKTGGRVSWTVWCGFTSWWVMEPADTSRMSRVDATGDTDGIGDNMMFFVTIALKWFFFLCIRSNRDVSIRGVSWTSRNVSFGSSS